MKKYNLKKYDTNNISIEDIDKCKELIKKYVGNGYDGGFFDCSNTVDDEMDVLFESSDLTLEVCHVWEYFECFTNHDTFSQLKEYYEQCVKEEKK